jgi:transcription antitermination factor NusG
MNRRNFIASVAVAVAAAGSMVGSLAKPQVKLRRVHILRQGQILKDQPFSAVRRGDAVKILSSPDDSANGSLLEVDQDAHVGENGLMGFDVYTLCSKSKIKTLAAL